MRHKIALSTEIVIVWKSRKIWHANNSRPRRVSQASAFMRADLSIWVYSERSDRTIDDHFTLCGSSEMGSCSNALARVNSQHYRPCRCPARHCIFQRRVRHVTPLFSLVAQFLAMSSSLSFSNSSLVFALAFSRSMNSRSYKSKAAWSQPCSSNFLLSFANSRCKFRSL